MKLLFFVFTVGSLRNDLEPYAHFCGSEMFENKTLAADFARHVTASRSGRIACSCRVAVEGWFRVELAEMLYSSGKFQSVSFGYDYPERGKKADLVVESNQGRIVFELKCFVKSADANKLKDWPLQLERLARLSQMGIAVQGVAISTFFDYKTEKVTEYVVRFHPTPWSFIGPLRFYEDSPLQLVVATASHLPPTA